MKPCVTCDRNSMLHNGGTFDGSDIIRISVSDFPFASAKTTRFLVLWRNWENIDLNSAQCIKVYIYSLWISCLKWCRVIGVLCVLFTFHHETRSLWHRWHFECLLQLLPALNRREALRTAQRSRRIKISAMSYDTIREKWFKNAVYSFV